MIHQVKYVLIINDLWVNNVFKLLCYCKYFEALLISVEYEIFKLMNLYLVKRLRLI